MVRSRSRYARDLSRHSIWNPKLQDEAGVMVNPEVEDGNEELPNHKI